ncbi:MAG: hypothetical protein AAB473_01225 [Patescibacteria group bacterium]
MISPLGDKPIPTLPLVHVLALMLFVNHEGVITPDGSGHIGRIIEGEAACLSEGSVWGMTSGPQSFQVFQRFTKVDREVIFAPGSKIYGADDPTKLKRLPIVSGFEAGVFGVNRAMRRAASRVKNEIVLLRTLVVMSDEKLGFALKTRLKRRIDAETHRENIRFLKNFVHSNAKLAKEIRAFLASMENPLDSINRRNVYRYVLIVRAIQRRAEALTADQHDVLEAVTYSGRDIEEWIGRVVQRCSRMATELDDKKSWWLGITTELPLGVSEQRVTNFVKRLKGYRDELKRSFINPILPWTAFAHAAVQEMIDGFEARQYNRIASNARRAAAFLKAVALRDQLSAAIQMVNSGDIDALQRFREAGLQWMMDCAPWVQPYHLREMGEITDLIRGVAHRGDDRADGLREIERRFDHALSAA